MSKIKLLILLLISFFIFSCTNNQILIQTVKNIKLAYIGGEYDGLLLKNYLTNYLKNNNIYDQNSNIEIQSEHNHSGNLYITNIDNTSDREKIKSKLKLKYYDKKTDCLIFMMK